jgi:DNA-binding response OmpR family regulator
VTANGRPVDLAWLEFQLLLFLMQNVGKVFTRDQLLGNVWGVENIGGTRTVDVHIRRLRYKLENGSDTYFRTVKNVGYGMVEP